MNYSTEILFFIMGGLLSSGIITIWNFSFISIHAIGWIYKDENFDTIDDLALRISQKHPKLSELLFCPLCLGFWLSIFLSILITYLNDFSLWYIPICAFSWPVFIFYFFKKFE